MRSFLNKIIPSSKTKRLRILSHVVAGYMLLAFLWWTILLLKKNDAVYEARYALLQVENIDDYGSRGQALSDDHARQRTMILGEGLVFVVALFFGIWFINRVYTKEIEIVRQKRNFLLAITHELKSPLASIRLIFETFRKRKLPPSDLMKLSGHGIQEAERLSTLVNNLLLSARLDKSYEPVFETADIGEIISNVTTDIKHLDISADVHLVVPQEPVMSHVDVTGMYSAIYNLVENAVKYGGHDHRVEVMLQDTPHKYEIQVKDNGIGIPSSERSKIFEQFYRAGQEDIRQARGTGIGLYIVAKMVELHQGSIEVKNNEPQGTIFVLTLPKAHIL